MKNIFITIATLAVVLFSCTDFLEEDPYVNLVQGEGIQSVEEMQMFVAGMYGTLTSGNSHLQFETLALLMSLDGSVFHRNGNLGMSNLTLYASTNSAYIAKTYEWFYYSIGEANTLISKISATGFEESVKNLYLGDAYFFRALNYYYLVLIYGGVPLRTEETSNTEVLPRSSKVDVFNQIITDLEMAEQLLPTQRNSSELGYATQASAKALLAKVYASMAGEMFSDEIGAGERDQYLNQTRSKLLEIVDQSNPSNSMFSNYYLTTYDDTWWVTDETSGFALVSEGVEFGPEYLFEISIDAEFDGSAMFVGIWNHASMASPHLDWFTDPQFFDPVNDYRIDRLIDTIPATGLIIEKRWGRYNAKWNGMEQNIPVLTYYDMVLLLAEVENEINGPTTLAEKCVNAIKARARLADGTPRSIPADIDVSSLSQSELRDIIKMERALELYYEYQTWIDHKRWGTFQEYFSSCLNARRTWIDAYNWLPIPGVEIEASNGVVTQTPGY